MRRIGLRKFSSGRLILALGALLAIIGIGNTALAGTLPASGTCRMLLVRSYPPPGSSFTKPVSEIITATLGSTPTINLNVVAFNWNGFLDDDFGTMTQSNFDLTGVAITPNAAKPGFYTLTGTGPGGLVEGNLVPTNGGKTIFVQIYSPHITSGVCQME